MPRPRKNPVKAAAEVVNAVKETVAEKSSSKAPTKVKTSVLLQMASSEWNIGDCKGRVEADFVAQGHKASEMKSLSIYLKPEEGKIYYVVNDETTGRFDL